MLQAESIGNDRRTFCLKRLGPHVDYEVRAKQRRMAAAGPPDGHPPPGPPHDYMQGGFSNIFAIDEQRQRNTRQNSIILNRLGHLRWYLLAATDATTTIIERHDDPNQPYRLPDETISRVRHVRDRLECHLEAVQAQVYASEKHGRENSGHLDRVQMDNLWQRIRSAVYVCDVTFEAFMWAFRLIESSLPGNGYQRFHAQMPHLHASYTAMVDILNAEQLLMHQVEFVEMQRAFEQDYPQNISRLF